MNNDVQIIFSIKKILGTDSNLMTMVIPPAMQPLKLIIPPTLKKEARVKC